MTTIVNGQECRRHSILRNRISTEIALGIPVGHYKKISRDLTKVYRCAMYCQATGTHSMNKRGRVRSVEDGRNNIFCVVVVWREGGFLNSVNCRAGALGCAFLISINISARIPSSRDTNHPIWEQPPLPYMSSFHHPTGRIRRSC